MFAAIDSLVPLLIFIVIAIVSAFLKKKGADQEEAPPPLPRMPRGEEQPQRTRKSWEDQLRELLQNQLPQPQPAPPPLPRQPVPPPVTRPQRGEFPGPRPHFGNTQHQEAESSVRYAHAASMGERMAQHMHDLRDHPVGLTTAERHDLHATHEAVAMVRNPKNLRAAILAAVILGPPKALEETR